MATLSVQQVVQSGLGPTYAAAAAGGDKVPPGENVWLHVKNTGGGAITVTVDSKTPSNYGTDADLSVSVPATNGERLIGPVPAQRFAGTDGLADITYSGVTGLSIGAFKI